MERMVMRELKGKGEICDPLDAATLISDILDTTSMSINHTVYWLTGKPDIRKLQEDFERKFAYATDTNGKKLFPRATRYLKCLGGIPVWIEETSFDIKDHVFLWDKNIPKDEEELRQLIGYFFSQPLPENLSRWQIILIPCNVSDGISEGDTSHVLLLRCHHSIGDGVAMVGCISQQFSNAPPVAPIPEKVAFKTQWWHVFKLLVIGTADLVIKKFTIPEYFNILHGCEPSGKIRVAWSRELDLHYIKAIKNAAGTTVNDVLVTCAAGSIRKHFKAHASAHESGIPNQISCYIPVSIRKPGSKLVMDNKISGFVFTLPTNTDKAIEGLMSIKPRIDALKDSSEHIAAVAIMKLVLTTFPKWLQQKLLSIGLGNITLTFVNVPIYKNKLSFAGIAVEKVVSFPPPGKGKSCKFS